MLILPGVVHCFMSRSLFYLRHLTYCHSIGFSGDFLSYSSLIGGVIKHMFSQLTFTILFIIIRDRSPSLALPVSTPFESFQMAKKKGKRKKLCEQSQATLPNILACSHEFYKVEKCLLNLHHVMELAWCVTRLLNNIID